ncbi:MAG: sugar phosphate isomerase/epimerase [Abditibacteriota bacterium]|nr:sugar phosphate isomerase/epimerase [Abditibacteriota bacterium]
MKTLKTGAFLSSFRMEFIPAMDKAKELGLTCLEFANVPGIDVFKPISDEQAAYIRKAFEDRGMFISSICGEVRGFCCETAEEAENKVALVKTVMDNGVKLGTKVIQLHIGAVPEDKEDPRYKNLTKSLTALEAYGRSIDMYIATETGPEAGSALSAYLRGLKLERIRVNFDPANLCMCGFDEVQSVYDLSDLIIQTHAKDGIRGSVKDGYKEVPLGQGDVRWDEYLAALEKVGFNGAFIIEREVGDNPADDIAMAAGFLKNYGKK